MDRHAPARAADIVGQPDFGVFDLALAAIAAQLVGDLIYLRQPRSRDRMAFGFQPARRVDRHLAAQIYFARTDQFAAFAGISKPDILVRQQLH